MVTISENVKQSLISQINRASEVAAKELKQSEKILIIDGKAIMKEEEDLRIVFVQVIEHLSALSIAYYDTRMQDYYSKNIIYLNGFYSEIIAVIQDKHFLDLYEDAPDTSENGKTKTDLMLAIQCKKAKEFFVELNLFFQRNNILSDALVEVKKHE